MQKTRRKNVLTMIGPFISCETVAYCSECRRTFGSDALLQLVQHRCNVGYDILVFVGQALFRRHRTAEEVRAELAERNIRLCASEIDYLGRKFIAFLAIAHRRATPRIRCAMNRAGGYILHLDATHDGGSPALMTGMDSLSQFVLANVKIPSEHADHIIPFLRQLEEDYGRPQACVHDMGTGISKAVITAFPNIRDFICHFHFLRDIGKDYLGPAYARLRNILRKHAASTRLHALAREMQPLLNKKSNPCEPLVEAIKTLNPLKSNESISMAASYSLVVWALHGKHCGDGYGFPFDRPLLEFARRLLELHQLMPQLSDLLLIGDEPQKKQPVFKLLTHIGSIAEDQEVCQVVEELHRRCQVFDRLRNAMRIAPAGGSNGLNDEGTAEEMSSIRQGVKKFHHQLRLINELVADPLSQKMAAQIDKYGDKLFADPITVTAPDGPITIYPQRTNNILEQFFRSVKRGYRRKTGNNSMQRALQAMLADTPLVKNLDNPDYMKILLEEKTNLEELFAELGQSCSSELLGLRDDTNRISPGFSKLMKLPHLPNQLIQSLTMGVNMVQSN